jgi:hypothetical protein
MGFSVMSAVMPACLRGWWWWLLVAVVMRCWGAMLMVVVVMVVFVVLCFVISAAGVCSKIVGRPVVSGATTRLRGGVLHCFRKRSTLS